MTGDLRLTREEAADLYIALGTATYVRQSQGKPVARLHSLQNRIDNIWAQLEHIEKVRRGSSAGETISSFDAVEGLASYGDFLPYA